MNFGQPMRNICSLSMADIDVLLNLLPSPESDFWDQGDFRNQSIASDHASTRNLILRHEWFNRDGVPYQTMDEFIGEWRLGNGESPVGHAPVLFRNTNICSVYDFPIQKDISNAFDKLISPVLSAIGCDNGIVIRKQITALRPNGTIPPHKDMIIMAKLSHRIQIPLTDGGDTLFIIGAKKVKFEKGFAYEINNQWRHQVNNYGDNWRINLIFDYLPDASVKNPLRKIGWRP